MDRGRGGEAGGQVGSRHSSPPQPALGQLQARDSASLGAGGKVAPMGPGEQPGLVRPVGHMIGFFPFQALMPRAVVAVPVCPPAAHQLPTCPRGPGLHTLCFLGDANSSAMGLSATTQIIKWQVNN